tara:strand:- start:867 stop:1226 length:360 start_codon:yes stop_codon:yes gene_type:complete
MVLENYSDRWYSTSGSKTANGSYQTIVPVIDVKKVDRISLQFINSGAAIQKVKVYGTLDISTDSTLGDTRWTQIGDDVTVAATDSSLKSISTTGLMYIGATASGTSSQKLDYNMLVQNL